MSGVAGQWRGPHKLPLFADQPWNDQALCAQADPEEFFPEKGGRNACRAAISVCQNCPVRAECLEWALDARERYGVWGGLSEQDRRKLLRDRDRAARGDVA